MESERDKQMREAAKAAWNEQLELERREKAEALRIPRWWNTFHVTLGAIVGRSDVMFDDYTLHLHAAKHADAVHGPLKP